MEAQAILFDLDGVLTDTAHYHYLAWKKLADSLGFHFNEKDNERLKGVDRMRSFEIVLEINDALDQFDQEARIRYADEKNEWYKKLFGALETNYWVGDAFRDLKSMEKVLKSEEA